MKRLALAILTAGFGLFWSQNAHAAGATYYISVAPASDSNACTQAAPCLTWTKVMTLHTAGDTIRWATGPVRLDIYATTTAGGFVGNINNDSHISATLKNIFGGYPGSTVTVHGFSEVVLNPGVQNVILEDMIQKDVQSDHAIQILAAHHNIIRRWGIKNGALWTAQYANIIEINGPGNGASSISEFNLLEDVWIDGVMRYGIVVGGTNDWAQKNILRRCVVRFNGSNSPEPHAGISNYGATSGILGARDNILQNCVTIDFNAADNQSGEGLYSGFYNPHAATNIDFQGCIAANTRERCFLIQEDAGSTGSDMSNCVCYRPNLGTGDGIVGQRGSSPGSVIDQVTVSSSNAGVNSYNGALFTVTNSLFMGNANGNSGTNSFNHYWNNTSGGSSPITTNPQTKYLLRIEANTPGYLSGQSGKTRGADVTFKYGRDGAIWGDTGYNTQSTECLFVNGQFPYEARIKLVFGMPDEGSWKTAMPSNNPLRGFMGASYSGLGDYLMKLFNANAVAFSSCSVAGSCGFQTSLNPTASGVTNSSFTVSWTTAGASQYVISLSTKSDFSLLMASGTLSQATSGYVNLTANKQYYFQVKVATEGDCALTSGSTITLAATGCGSQTSLISSFTAVNSSSVTVSFSSVGANTFKAVFSNTSDFSNILSSGTLTGPPTTYMGLSPTTTYYFEVKIATESCGYSPAISTATLATPVVVSTATFSEPPYKAKIYGPARWFGSGGAR